MAKTDNDKPKKYRKNTKEDKGMALETILSNCRDYLRGSAAINDKHDIILTLVFLRFIGNKFEEAQAKMRQMCLDQGLSEDMVISFLCSSARYKNIVYVPAARWSKLINVPSNQLNAALDDALQAIDDSGEALKGCVKLTLFTNVNIQPNDLKKVVDEENKISHKNWADNGTPPESNANYAWILHMLSKIKADKGIAGFLLANGALGDEDSQAIRQKLIEKDTIEAIIVLPRELLYTTDISVTLWILNQNKRGCMHHGRCLRDRSGEILFMDLRSWTENSVKGEQKKKSQTYSRTGHPSSRYLFPLARGGNRRYKIC